MTLNGVLFSRMKKDWIHFGRRPSGLCGAALLIAARLHMFHRSVSDVIKVVKVHESTLRKRLNEFGETPASQLTLDEFMNIDLDAMTEEQDPPSFKAARKKDKERLLHLETEGDLDDEINKLETLIEKELLEKRAKLKGPYSKMARESIVPLSPSSTVSGASPRREKDRESLDAEDFIAEQTLATVSEIVESGSADTDLMPPPNRKGIIASPGLGLKDTIQEYLTHPTVPAGSGSAGSNYSGKKEEPGDSNEADEEDDELDLEGIDDDEIDGYIMSESEAKFKTDMWMKVNAEYLKEKAEKEERERKEEEEAIKEGREIKKKKRAVKKPKVNMGGNQTAIEAIEKIVQEKKISTKINYDVLRSLNMLSTPTREATDEESGAGEGPFGKSPADTPTSVGTVFSPALGSDPSSGARRAEEDDSVEPSSSKRFKSDSGKSVSKKEPDSKSSKTNSLSNGKESTSEVVEKVLPIEMQEAIVESGPIEKHVEEEEEEEHFDDEEDIDESCLSASQLLAKHRGDMGEDEDAYNYGEEEEDYY